MFLIFIYVIALWTSALSEPLGCQSPQSLELNMLGTIRCNLGSNIKKVFWYDSLEDGTQSSPIIVFNKEKNQTVGSGLENHEYGITTAGNLVIMEVSWHHERRYRVICIGSNDSTSIHFVEVQVIVFSYQDSPFIHGCQQEPCLHHFKSGEIIVCSFKAAKPPANLSWFEVTTMGQIHIPSKLEVTKDVNGTYDTVAYSAVHFSDVDFIKYYRCELDWLAPEWKKFANIIAVSSTWYGTRNNTDYHYATMNAYAELRCGDYENDFNIWKKLTLAGELEQIGFFWKRKSIVEAKYLNSLHINEKGNLVFQHIGFEEEGKYVCQYSNEYQDGVKVIALVLVVLPSPPYLHVKECTGSDICVLEHSASGSLTCSLNGVYPDANLTWVPTDPTQLSFTHSEKTKNTRGKLLDVSTTSSYEFLSPSLCEEQLFIKCQVSGPVSEFIHSSITIQIERDGQCYWLGKTNSHVNVAVALLSITAVVCFIIGCLGGKYLCKEQEQYKELPQKEDDVEDNYNFGMKVRL